MDSEVMQVMDTQAYTNATTSPRKGFRWAPFLLLGLVACGVGLQVATLSMVADLNDDMDDLEDQTPPPAASPGRVVLQRCPTVDPMSDGAPIAVPPEFDREFVGTYPAIPNVMSLAGFRFTSLDKGQMDATMSFLIPNATHTLGGPASPPAGVWCSEVGTQSFRIQFYGLCLHYTDAEYSYVKVVAESQLSTDCFGKPKPGGCRLVRVSRSDAADVAVHGTWTEFELPPAALGGGTEWEHEGSKMGMRIKYSLCPDRIDDANASKKVDATF